MLHQVTPLDAVYHILKTGTKEQLLADEHLVNFYNQFNIKIVPYQEVLKILKPVERAQSEVHYGRIISEMLSKNDDVEDPNQHYLENCEPGTRSYDVRQFTKMSWLINDIKNHGLKEPITVILSPEYNADTQEINIKKVSHPGSFRFHALQIMDLNPDIIVFDHFNFLPEYKKVGLEDLLNLYNDDDTYFEIAILPNPDNHLTPQILNIAGQSRNGLMMESIEKYFEDHTKKVFNKKWKIFVGYDGKHTDAAATCVNSIYYAMGSQMSKTVEVELLDISKIPEYTREYKNQSTEFAYSRFLVPYLSNYEGMSIFVDDDYIFTKDIRNLFYFINHDQAVSCVQHNFEEKYNTKFNNEKDVWYPKKLWSSLMVFNNEHPDCKKLTPEIVNTESGKYLHQFEWTDKIGSIPKMWAWTEGYDDINSIHHARGLHWTRGGPWIEDMNCSEIQGLSLYDYYRSRHIDLKVFQSRFCAFVNPHEWYDMNEPLIDENSGTKTVLKRGK